MSYYLQDSDSTLNGYPQVADLFPDGVQSKSELVDFLDEAFAEVKNDPEIEGIVNWVSYWTGFNANAGTVYALSTEYANQIGYNGPTTAKTQNFILVLDKYIEQNVRDLVAKMKKSKSVKNIDENEILSRGEYIGDTYYGEPYHSRRSKYYKYNDKFYEFTEGSDEYGGWEEVDSFVMTHPKPGYERYSASTKKSQDIHSMIAQIRKNNNSLKKSRIDISIGKNFYDNPYQDAEDEFQREMASLGRILSDSGIDYNLKDIEVSDGYGYEIVFHSFDDGKRVFDKVADWGDAHGFYTWLKDEGIITLTPN